MPKARRVTDATAGGDALDGEKVSALHDVRVSIPADVGGLLSYDRKLPEMCHRCGVHDARILAGKQAIGHTGERPTTFEFVINLETAKALRLTIPQSLLLRADQVIV